MDLIKDLPSGPLDEYRKKASFNWKKLKSFLKTPKLLNIENEIYAFLETHPLFQHPDHDMTVEEERSLSLRRINVILGSKIFNPDDYYADPVKTFAISTILGKYDWALGARKGLQKDFCISAILGQGTDRHNKYLSAMMENRVAMAFCLTEIAHGTNTRGMRTEARYDVETKSFILHTPDFEAAKCWAGCLGKLASHGLVFAQLFTPDRTCHGLHCFIVPVRNSINLQPFPGVTIMDMGPKLGLNSLDNGVLIFNHYSIPMENLLNKTGDVTEDGHYVTPYKDPRKRFGASLGNLSVGRVSITALCLGYLSKALTIAIRYSAVRRQFGSDGQHRELPVLEYPLQQWRLFPFLGGLYVGQVLAERLRDHLIDFLSRTTMADNPDQQAKFGQELHALSSVSKPFSGWLARDGIQECREACGGHGYLRAAGFGYLRNDIDASLTYEGDNNVLLQQTSNWILNVWENRHSQSAVYPMRTVDFIDHGDQILTLNWPSNAFQSNLADEELIQRTHDGLEWLTCWLCQKTLADMNDQLAQSKDHFTAKNNAQIYRAHTLSLVYIERVLVAWFMEHIEGADMSLQPPLKRLCLLFILTRFLKHVPLLLEGGLLQNGGPIIADIQRHVQRLLSQILPDAVALVDAVALPDIMLRSVLGNADGKVYEHMYQKMITAPNALTRDKDWQLISYTEDKFKAKL